MKKFFIISFSILSVLFLTAYMAYNITLSFMKQSENTKALANASKKTTMYDKDILSSYKLDVPKSSHDNTDLSDDKASSEEYTDSSTDSSQGKKVDGTIINDTSKDINTEDTDHNIQNYKENIHINNDMEVFTPKPSPPKGYIELNSIPERDFYVYGRIVQENNYDKIAVHYKGKLKYFSWNSNKTEASLYLDDYNSDGKDEAVIVLNGASGTGIYESTVHVLSLEKLYEIKVQDLNDIIKKNTSFELKSDKIVLKLKAVAYEISLSKSYVSSKEVYKSIGIGACTLYSAEDGKIQCSASVQSLPDGYHGDVIITFKVENGIFTADTLKYEPQSDDNNEINENWMKLYQL